MKFPKGRAIANEGVAYVNKIVSESKSIFRHIYGEVDVGLDGYVEFVDDEKATGELVAVQIKSGTSYATGDGNYSIPSDREHFRYWKKSVVPVAGIVYDPAINKAFWTNISDVLENNPETVENGPFVIRVPHTDEFNASSFTKEFRKSFVNYRQLADLYTYGDLMLSDNVKEKWQGFLGLTGNERALDSRLACHLFAILATDANISLRANICDAISRYMSHPEVGFFNIRKEVRKYMESTVKTFGYEHVYGMLEAIDENGLYRGSLGQSFAVVMGHIPNLWQHVRRIIFDEPSASTEVRFHAIMLAGLCNLTKALPSLEVLRGRAGLDPDLKEAVEAAVEMLEHNKEIGNDNPNFYLLY